MSFAPVAMAVVGTGLQVAGSFANMRREQRQASMDRQAAMRNARLSERDARLEEKNAVEEVFANQVEGEEWGISAAEQIGQLIAERSASGTLMLGSNENRVEGLRLLAQRDQMRIRQEGVLRLRENLRRARNIREQGENYQREAYAAGVRRRDATVSGFLNMGSSLIGGAQSIQTAKGL